MPNAPWGPAPITKTSGSAAPWETPDVAKDFVTSGKKPNQSSMIVQEQPNDLSNLHRFEVANLANDPQSAANFLREHYPNHEIGIIDDQIGMRPKGSDKAFNAVTPKLGLNDLSNPGKVLHRATDFTADIGNALATTAAGGLAAGATGLTGPGALVAGAGAAGTTGAAYEGLRQGLGRALGVNKEINPETIANQGATNAAGSLVFGAGPAKGAVGTAYDFAAKKVFPKIGSMVSGVPAKTISVAAEKLPAIAKLEKEGVLDFAQQAHDNIDQGLQKAKQMVGQNIQQGIENANGSVDVTAARKPFEDLLAKLKNQYQELKTPELKDKIKDVEEKLNYYFSREPMMDSNGQMLLDSFGNPVTEVMSAKPAQAFSLKQSMADLGELDKVRDNSIKSSLAGLSPAQKDIAVAARQSKKALDEGIGKAVDAADATTGGMANLRTQYRDLTNLQENLEPHFKTPEKTYNTMRNMAGKSKEVLMQNIQNMDKKYGTNALENAKMLDAYNYFGKPSNMPISQAGTTSTTRSIPLSGAGLALGYAIGNKFHMGPALGYAGMMAGATMGSPAAIRQYMRVGNVIRGAGNVLGPATPAIPQAGLNIFGRQDNMAPQSPWTLFPNQGEQK